MNSQQPFTTTGVRPEYFLLLLPYLILLDPVVKRSDIDHQREITWYALVKIRVKRLDYRYCYANGMTCYGLTLKTINKNYSNN